MIHTVNFIFNVCIGLGLSIPLISVVLGFYGSFVDVDFDIGGSDFDVGGDGNIDGGIPVNIMCLCFSLAVFGALGRLFSDFMTSVIAVIGIFIGLILLSFGAYMLIYKYIVKPLQNNKASVLNQWDLFGTKGKLTLRIMKDKPGTVSLKDSTGAMISFIAAANDDVLNNWNGIIPQGTEVIVVDVVSEIKTVFVKPLDTLENHKLRIK